MQIRTILTFALILLAHTFAQSGELEIRAVDRETRKPIAVRVHLKDQRGNPVKPPNAPFWHDHFVFEDRINLKLRPGRYTFEMERGPECRIRYGYFTIERNAKDVKTVDMARFVDMAKEGWWSGDLHIHRPPEDIEALMKADDLHVAPVITWWNGRNFWQNRPLPKKPVSRFDDNRLYNLLAGEDERNGGALLYFNLPKPLDLPGSRRAFPEHPSPMEFVQQAGQFPDAHIDIEKPFWRDVPMWIASGRCDSIGLANNHQNRGGMLDNEAWGKPRDRTFFPSPHGNGRWSQAIYYHLLNCGLRIPPSAGSASGVLPNPVGYNRVYVQLDGELEWDKWWEGLRAGRVIVTNGPLIRPRVNGQYPGHVFEAPEGQKVQLDIALSLATRDRIQYLEIVKNGEVAHQVRLEDWAKARGRLPQVEFEKSGWMLIRAVTDVKNTYRFASTGPYYVDIGYQPRISRKSAEFFFDWANERAENIEIADPSQREEVMRHHRRAQTYWEGVVKKANAD